MLSVLAILIAVGMLILSITANAIMKGLPFVSGLLSVVFLIYSFPGLKNLIPGESKTSILAVIILVEVIIFALVNYEQTSAPMVIASSMFFIGIAMMIIVSTLEFASWQKTVFVTIMYVVAAAIVLKSNFISTGVDRSVKRNIVAGVVASILYALAVGINMFIILGCIWAEYVKVNYSQSFYEKFDNGGLVVIVIAMAITAVLSVIRDRKQVVYVEES